jgi:LacI family transcriptional regulator
VANPFFTDAARGGEDEASESGLAVILCNSDEQQAKETHHLEPRAGAALADLPPRARPTAVFCANDLLALGVLQEMTAQRIRVPEDIALIGYDDIDFAAAAAVPLSSVRQPRQLLGRTAAQLLLEEALGEEAHQHRQVVFEPELVVRRSSQAQARGRG